MDVLNSFGFYLLAFIFVLGVMIFIHELGHHLVAKLVGIRVETFSLGFGPRLFGFRWGDTDYRVSLLPLGGYVKMAGENVTDEVTGAPDEFLSKPRWQRFLVAVAGPAMNVALAVGLLSALYMVGVQVPAHLDEPPVIGYVAQDSPAAEAGLQEGDRILSINGVPTETWETTNLQIATSGGQTLPIRILREGREIAKQVEIQAMGPSEEGSLGIAHYLPFEVESLQAGGPAEQGGLKEGDRILEAEVGGQSAQGFYEIRWLVSSQEPGTPIRFEVRRDGRTVEKVIAPELHVEGDREQVAIGAVPRIPADTQKFALAGAIGKAIERNVQVTSLLFKILRQIFTGDTSVKTLSGPIEIARFSGEAARLGPTALINFMAFISLQLGILNLLPIPILDGGVILMLAIEGLMGRDLSMQVKERILQVGFLFLVLLMGFVIINDITKML